MLGARINVQGSYEFDCFTFAYFDLYEKTADPD